MMQPARLGRGCGMTKRCGVLFPLSWQTHSNILSWSFTLALPSRCWPGSKCGPQRAHTHIHTYTYLSPCAKKAARLRIPAPRCGGCRKPPPARAAPAGGSWASARTRAAASSAALPGVKASRSRQSGAPWNPLAGVACFPGFGSKRGARSGLAFMMLAFRTTSSLFGVLRMVETISRQHKHPHCLVTFQYALGVTESSNAKHILYKACRLPRQALSARSKFDAPAAPTASSAAPAATAASAPAL